MWHAASQEVGLGLVRSRRGAFFLVGASKGGPAEACCMVTCLQQGLYVRGGHCCSFSGVA